MLLETKGLGITFEGLKALQNINMQIDYGELVGLIGPNGAGKTTIFNLLTGVYLPTEGEILIEGENVVGKSPHQLVVKGVTRTFQNIRLFKELSVLDNVKMAFHHKMTYGVAHAIIRLPGTKFWKEESEIDEKSKALLKLFKMEHLSEECAKNLPYGEQRKLEIARALATEPKILLLDEPAAGMNPQETKDLMETIKFIQEQFKVAILLIEHDMKLVMGICERIIVIDYGKVIARGTPDEIKANPKVIGAYLGG